MQQSIFPRSVVLVALASIAVSAAPPACSLNAEGEHYNAAGVEGPGGPGASSGGPGSTSTTTGDPGATSSGPGGTGGSGVTGSGGAGGEGGGGTSMSASSSSSSSSGTGGEGGSILPICGDGMINEGEECDDMDLDPLDGCSGCLVTCPGNWAEEPTTHHCFAHASMTDASFAAANTSCGNAHAGAKLAVLATQAELDFVQGWPDEKTWIGGSYDGSVWVWLSGENMVMTEPPWATDEPSMNDDCVALGYQGAGTEGKFLGESCTSGRDYICEWAPPGTVP